MNQDKQTFIPYVTIGFIAFSWMTSTMNNGVTLIISSSGPSIKTSPGPLSPPALRSFAMATIQFHNAVVIVAVMIIFQVHVTWAPALAVGVVAIAVNGSPLALWLGPVVARYRDVGPIITSLNSVLFFFTIFARS